MATTSPEKTAQPTEEELLANDRAVLDFASEEEDEEDDEEEEDAEEENAEEDGNERPAKRQRREKEPSAKTIEVPRKATFTRADKINNAIMKATGNSPGGFAMFDTSSSIPMMMVYKKEIAAARKFLTAKKYQDAFCVAMATYLSMQDYDVWFSDTEDSRGVETLFTSFYRLWNDIFKSSDEIIGLKGRDVLTEQLRKFGNSAKEAFDYNFKWFE
ncbi:unnamed protein product [Aphanomyces euteiches]|uniref:Uncharacterized protein n=1 Tax=Aphanomyces euteiches TaxID=100861 RepID=A0A6G0WBS1_9STRA|nr:hypothetical protein Ae201684_016757 [Aphanomyces euteiches]KAH9083087.1 hypothetical protein Ae201684P_013988 [Aphanomyces euteiches]KAH9156050.1 hypothetical protein AeRB84_002036 [Aphanomyces euteiches]